jgi:16S rRNA (guanine1516-N2)-methyltransferase
MQLHSTCAIAYMEQHPECRPDVIYCDPMFAPRKKSAAVKKSIRVLQEWVGEDEDATQLVALALQRAQKRVVVKRAKTDPLLHPAPTFSLEGRAHCYDVYALSRI